MDEGEQLEDVQPRQLGIAEAARGDRRAEQQVRRVGGAADRVAARHGGAVDPDAGVARDQGRIRRGGVGHDATVAGERRANNIANRDDQPVRTSPPRLCLPQVCLPDRKVAQPSAAPVWRSSWKLNGSTSEARIAAALPIGGPPAQWR